MISWHQGESMSFWIKKILNQTWYFFIDMFLLKYRTVHAHLSSYSLDPTASRFSCFFKWKFISSVRFKDIEGIQYDGPHTLTLYKKRSFRGASTNEKLVGINVLNPIINVYNEKKIKISFIVHSYVSKYFPDFLVEPSGICARSGTQDQCLIRGCMVSSFGIDSTALIAQHSSRPLWFILSNEQAHVLDSCIISSES